VADLDGDAVKVRAKGDWQATVTVLVLNAGGDPVDGAVVSGTWSSGAPGTATCTTGADGTCALISGVLGKKTADVTFTVAEAVHDAYAYEPAENADPDGDSDGVTITLYRP
jgi:hypothetical protein